MSTQANYPSRWTSLYGVRRDVAEFSVRVVLVVVLVIVIFVDLMNSLLMSRFLSLALSFIDVSESVNNIKNSI